MLYAKCCGDRATIEIERETRYEETLLAKGFLQYTIDGAGLHVRHRVAIVPEIAQRAGLELVTEKGFERLTYYAHGKVENYCDRLGASPLGVYESTVSDEHFPFVPPSENGGHEGMRYLRLLHEDGREIEIVCAAPLHFDAHHNTIEDYRTAKHDHELPEREETYIHIDAAHGQIGGDISWSSGLDAHLFIGRRTHTEEFTVILR